MEKRVVETVEYKEDYLVVRDAESELYVYLVFKDEYEKHVPRSDWDIVPENNIDIGIYNGAIHVDKHQYTSLSQALEAAKHRLHGNRVGANLVKQLFSGVTDNG